MSNLILSASKRTLFGKKIKTLKQEGFIPAILYGRTVKPTPLTINLKEFLKIYETAGETDLIDLKIKDENKENIKTVLIQEVSHDFVSDEPIHVDFYAVEMDKPITTHVPLEFIGESLAVKNGGILVKSMEELEIETLPKYLPHRIEVDISSLNNFDETIYVKDLKLPEGVKTLVKGDNPVVTVTQPITQEELEAELGKVQSVEEIEVEKKEEQTEEEIKTEEQTKEAQSHE